MNDAILGRFFPEERATAMLERYGFPPGTPIRQGAALNQLDDWLEFHRCLTEE